jgi:hypothetical protein
VNAAGTHLLSLINEILDLSKIEAGKLELNPEPVNLTRLIDEVIGTAGQLAEKNKNRLIVEAQEKLGALTADPMRLKQILLKLLSNACKFTKEGEVALIKLGDARSRSGSQRAAERQRLLSSRDRPSFAAVGAAGMCQDLPWPPSASSPGNVSLHAELPTGCAELLFFTAALMPSAGMILKHTDIPFLAGASGIDPVRPHGRVGT